MTRRQLLSVAGALCASRLAAWATPPGTLMTESQLLARRRAFEAARRMAAAGWKIRDGLLHATLGAGAEKAVGVHLLAGVQYLFLVAWRPFGAEMGFQLLDDEGQQVAASFAGEESRLLGILHTPTASQRGFLHCQLPTLSPTGDAALLYVYR